MLLNINIKQKILSSFKLFFFLILILFSNWFREGCGMVLDPFWIVLDKYITSIYFKYNCPISYRYRAIIWQISDRYMNDKWKWKPNQNGSKTNSKPMTGHNLQVIRMMLKRRSGRIEISKSKVNNYLNMANIKYFIFEKILKIKTMLHYLNS